MTTGRNQLPAAMRCAAYLSGFVVLWGAANGVVAYVAATALEFRSVHAAARHLLMSGKP